MVNLHLVKTLSQKVWGLVRSVVVVEGGSKTNSGFVGWCVVQRSGCQARPCSVRNVSL